MMRKTLVFLCLALAAAVCAQDDWIREWWTLESTVRSGRIPVHTDSVDVARIAGTPLVPGQGQVDGKTWNKATAEDDGTLRAQAAYVGFTFESESDQVMVLEASGHSFVIVNGELRGGDVYGYGYTNLPVALRKGQNTFVFRWGRGGIKARLAPIFHDYQILLEDSTLPDVIAGDPQPLLGGIRLRNNTPEQARDLRLVCIGPSGAEAEEPVRVLPALTVTKVPFAIPADPEAGEYKIRLMRDHRVLYEQPFSLRLRQPSETRKVTFRSGIDGSVQYYGVHPASQPGARALFLSLHGASVEAIGQADAYGPKTWGTLVAPTNRRPYGFDWEEWGRMDALEVLAHAESWLRPDPRRIYLTGHSMGGHGTWQIGAHFSDRFAAIAPCAGWESFFTYAGGQRPMGDTPIQRAFAQAGAPSDTRALLENLLNVGVFVLHGDADETVPPSEARTMIGLLEALDHPDLRSHFEPGGGHWYDNDPEPGADCLDYRPIWDFFARRVTPTPAERSHIRFVTASPGISSRFAWAEVIQQQKPFAISRVQLELLPHTRTVRGSIENVALMRLDSSAFATEGPVRIELEGVEPFEVAWSESIWFGPSGPTEPVDPAHKHPGRYGAFKEALKRNFVIVYGTRGTPEENAWARAKAIYDAESFLYRGNASPLVLADTDFDPASHEGDVMLIGNADTHEDWSALLGHAPITVRRGSAKIGERMVQGDDLVAYFAYPARGSEFSVAVIAPTGIQGGRFADTVPLFLSGVAFPDLTLFGAETRREGFGGVRAAGFFANDWSVGEGIVWRD